MNIDLTSDVKAAEASLKSYQRKKLPNTIRMTLNKTIRGVLTDTKRVMSKRIGMNQREIAARTELIFAEPGKLQATMLIKGERRVPNLSNFAANQRAKGVSAKVWEKRKTYRGTFLLKKGKGTVFKRVGGAAVGPTYKTTPTKGRYAGKVIRRGPRAGQPIMRQPIEPVFGTSLRRTFIRSPRGAESPQDTIRPMAIERFKKEFNRQINRIK